MIADVPPNAVEIEQAVIGAVLLEKGAYGKASFLSPECFYQRAHEVTWRIIEGLDKKGEPIDLLTVATKLQSERLLEQAGGPFYISQLINKIGSTANLEAHARIVQQKYMLRRIIQIGGDAARTNDSHDPFERLDEINNSLSELNVIANSADPLPVSGIMDAMVANKEPVQYMFPDMGDLDRHFCMGPGQVTVIGARPATGKSSFVLNIAMNLARMGHKSLFVSLEMSAQQLTSRICSSITGIDSERITRNDINEEERQRIADALIRHGAWISRMMIDDRASLHANQVAGLLERAVKRHGCKVAVIDYLQLMDAEGGSTYERMTEISKACKRAAKASGISLIELSQLKRRDGAEVNPEMSDLRESGQIEADGDAILLLGREPGAQDLLVKVAKNKIGPIGNVVIPFNLSTQRIGNFNLIN